MFIDERVTNKFVNELGYIGNYDLLGCFNISIKKNERATAFVFSYNRKQYIITSEHVVSRKRRFKKREVTLMRQETNIVFEADIHYHPNREVDLCVIEVPKDLYFECRIENKKTDLIIGQEYFISGFPSLVSSGISVGNQGDAQKLPIVRSGVLSSVVVRKNVFQLLLDFQTSPGFSGSPVFKISKRGNISVIGVVSGAVLDLDDDEYSDEYDPRFNVNDFTIAVPIEYAIEIIDNIDKY